MDQCGRITPESGRPGPGRVLASGEFWGGGNNVPPVVTYSESDQVVLLSGGGSCGWVGSGNFDPYNTNGGFTLRLLYDPTLLSGGAQP